MMDLNFLHSFLNKAIDEFHQASQIRYRTLGFSSKDLRVLDDVGDRLKALLPAYALWAEPGIMGAPAGKLSRQAYVRAMLSVSQEGLIIQQPEQWWSYWPLTDKQAFWSTLSMLHGGKKIIVVFAAGDEFQQINNAYFKSLALDGLPIQVWRPVRAA